MRGTRAWGGLVLAGILGLAACGGGDEVADEVAESASAPAAGPGGGASAGATAGPVGTAGPAGTPGPDTVVSSGPLDAPTPGAFTPSYQLVEPRPGMANLHPVGWERAETRAPDRLRIYFWGGIEPCYVLDHVKVAYGAGTVTVSLYAGSDPAKPGVACIEIARAMAVDVRLDEPLDGRRVVDGSTGQSPTAPPAGAAAGSDAPK